MSVLRLGDRLAGLQPSNDAVVVTAARSVGNDRDPDVRRLGRGLQVRGKVEAGRHDADDEMVAAVEGNRPADDGRIRAELPLPETVAQDGDIGLSWPALFGQERASEHGVHAEDREQAGRHAHGDQHLRVLAMRQPESSVAIERESLERARLPRPVLEVGIGRPVAPALGLRIGFPHLNQAVRVGVRKRSDQRRVHRAEDRRVGANGEGERQDADDGKARLAHEAADGEPQIARNGIQKRQHALVVPALRDRLRAAQPEDRLRDEPRPGSGRVERCPRSAARGGSRARR